MTDADITNKPVVLIIDDQPTNLQLLAAVLKSDYRVKVARDGRMGLALAGRDPAPDLILLDVVMPEIDGYEVLNRLNGDERTRDIPVIFITGRTNVEDEERGLKLGAVDYIAKPISPPIVQIRVKTHITIKQQRDELHRIAMHDHLTSLYNRHYLNDIFPRQLAKSGRHDTPLSLVMVDLDHFKAVNDTHGHEMGDTVLKEVSAELMKVSRTEDIIVRLGGEEFVVLLDHCNIEDGRTKAEHFRQAVEDLMPGGLRITASFGVTQLRPRDGLDELLRRADVAVYEAKSGGRNRVIAG